ncbi:hypothetical protein [Sediminitomix flava]|uniref:Outer membrane protein with beta-barrel domain n=1 Tax=Sediminitomix flava TaxID=379075 RepID=A0A315YWP9_SEDFL|nr:hypothetical protein [Sediminitomix flava]PWJ33675.1 hypothetical protein BC781_11222 [Sediminitomix flava]
MKHFLFSIICSFLFLQSNAQSDWSLRTNAGSLIGEKGYYFSFDIGIPIVKGLELAPTFMSSSRISQDFLYANWSESDLFYSVPEKEEEGQEITKNVSSLSLLLLLKPLDWLSNWKSKKHEILLGGGVSYSRYTMLSSRYNGEDLVSLGGKVNSGIEPYYFKVAYNYLFTESLFGGLVFSSNGYDGDAVTMLGLQFGVKF